MRITWIALLLIWCSFAASAQLYFPVKVNKKWGLINAEGQIVQPPVYDAIGEFKQFGYAVMQRNGKVGLLNKSGREVIAPSYEDLKVLDSLIVAVMNNDAWQVINLDGDLVVEKGYEQVNVLSKQYIAFRKNQKWGIVHYKGKMLSEPKYDEILLEKDKFFLTRKGEKLGLLTIHGKEILETIADEVNFFSDSLIFYKFGNRWGAISNQGSPIIPPQYDAYTRISDSFIKLIAQDKLFVYSVACSKIISPDDFDDFYPFSKKYVIVKKNRQLGLLDWCGNIALAPQYFEIQPYHGDLFRVNYKGKWGIVQLYDQPMAAFRYDYIAPLRGSICLMKKAGKFGVLNFKGEEIIPADYHRIEIENNRAKAYKSSAESSSVESLTLIEFNEEGALVGGSAFEKHFLVKISGKKPSTPAPNQFDENDYLLDQFEWFYSPLADRWGLRRLADGSIQIEPQFYSIKVLKDLGLTLVGMQKSNRFEFERTTYRFDMVYGLVNNQGGILVTDVDFWDVRFEDFYKGSPVARFIASNGRHGLVDRIGRVVKKDFAYIGEFKNGVARTSIKGKLSGSIKDKNSLGDLATYLGNLQTPHNMVDYTQYDQLFQKEAVLICENCEWGYIDTSGQMIVTPKYSFAHDLVNEVGIVECSGKWGMVDRKGKVLIPCNYDGIHFLENTNNQIVKVYVQEPKYGLIDTLGQIAVSAVYEEIGYFKEERLAVKRNGMWGFTNGEGLEVIPCRFREVANFSEGLAAVKLGRYWGFIDKQGDIEIDFKYLRAGNFNSGLAWVATPKGTGYINRKENFVIHTKFDKAFDFQENVARVVVDGKYGLIDLNGKFVVKPKYGNIEPFDQHGLAIVRNSDRTIRYGIINREGSLVVNISFNEIQPFSEGLAAVKTKEGYGFIDITGKLVIPCIYSKVSAFQQGRAAVYKDGACGYINKTGNEVVPFEFSKCLEFDGGKAVVYRGIRRAGLINLEGNLILEPSVDRLLKFREGRGLVRDSEYRFYYITEHARLYNGYYEKASEFQHGVAVVQINGKWGIINRKGMEVIPPKYDKIESFENGYARVRVEGFNGLTNLHGKLIVQPNFEYISYAGDGLFRVEQGDKIGYFDQHGNWVWTLSK